MDSPNSFFPLKALPPLASLLKKEDRSRWHMDMMLLLVSDDLRRTEGNQWSEVVRRTILFLTSWPELLGLTLALVYT